MKVKIKREEILRGLQRVQGVTEKRNTMPILSNILIEAMENNLKIFATDLELGVSGAYKADILEEGRICVSGKRLYEIIKELRDEEVSINKLENNWITLESGQSRFKIAGLPPDEFPSLPPCEEAITFSVQGKVLNYLIQKTIFAVGENDVRYILNGVLINLINKDKGSVLRVVGTDGHRLAIAETRLENSVEKEGSAVVPKKAIAEVRKIMDDTAELTSIGIGKTQVVFQSGACSLTSRVMEGNYPNYQQVIPKDTDKKVIVSKKDIEGALKRASILAGEKTKLVRLSIEEGRIELTSSSPEVGEAQDIIPAKYKGGAVAVGFNARYLLDAIAVIEGDEVLFEFKDQASPCLIREKESNNCLSLVMPMRI
ncbi:MAG: DNA polymerase III subunit beta [Nitrospirota bacterium]